MNASGHEGPTCTSLLTAKLAWDLHARFYNDLSEFQDVEPEAIRIVTRILDHDLEEGSGFICLSGLRSLSIDLAQSLGLCDTSGLDLSGLEDLSPEVAHALAQNPHQTLDLSGLRTLSVESALALSAHSGPLNLSGLQTTTEDLASALARHTGTLHLGGIRSLTNETLQKLAAGTGSLVLSGIVHLPLESLPSLASNRQRLDLSGLTELPMAAAKILSRPESPAQLQLNGIQRLDEDLAALLALRTGTTTLDGCDQISDGAFHLLAQAASQPNTKFRLSGLSVLSQPKLRSLELHPSDLNLTGLTVVTPDSAEALIRTHPNFLLFENLNYLSTEAASVLSRYAGHGIHPSLLDRMQEENSGTIPVVEDLHSTMAEMDRRFGILFRSLSSITPEAAEALCHVDGLPIELNSLTTLCERTASAMAAGHRHWRLWGIREVSPETARAIACSEYPLDCSGLTSLSTDVARELAKCRWGLQLSKITSLSTEEARELRNYQGPSLNLSGLSHLDTDTARVLAEYPVTFLELCGPGKLSLLGLNAPKESVLNILLRKENLDISLNGLTELSPHVASLCADRDIASLNFPSTLSQLSVEAAEALVLHRGSNISAREYWSLKLPGLTEIPESLAEVLKQYPGALILPGVRSLSEASAAHLAQHTGAALDLSGVSELSDRALELLATHRTQLLLRGLTGLSISGARALARHPYPLHLPGLKCLQVEVLDCLGEHRAKWDRYGQHCFGGDRGFFLNLNGLENFTDEFAEAISRQPGGTLFLGFAHISDRALKTLNRIGLLMLKAIPETINRYCKIRAQLRKQSPHP
ncbi:MAG: hypothetical protein JNN07_23665 [Verrucomicrobiales bacterium]|nr:hypothetical protein [Verrucomicrobiales bacterium]